MMSTIKSTFAPSILKTEIPLRDFHHAQRSTTSTPSTSAPTSTASSPTSSQATVTPSNDFSRSVSSYYGQNKPTAREKRSTKSKCSPGLRSGKWTIEEEAFTNRIIYYFKQGLLPIEDGTSLRWYLAKRLNCEAMRVTKKLKGNSSIGKQIFRGIDATLTNQEEVEQATEDIAMLEQQFLESVAATSTLSASSSTCMTASKGSSAASSYRMKKTSPPKSMGTLTPPHLEASKTLTHRLPVKNEDAKLLIHFFTKANGSYASMGIERKRLFRETQGPTGLSVLSDSIATFDEETRAPPLKRPMLEMEASTRS